MTSTLHHTIESAKNMMDCANAGAVRAVGQAKHAAGSVGEGAGHAASSARATWWPRLKTLTEIVTMLRGFHREDALGWFGLARRRSPLVSIGIFGAGVVVGASMGALLAPRSGADTRRLILSRFDGLRQQAGSAPERASSQVGAVAEQTVEAEERATRAAKPDRVGDDVPRSREPDEAPVAHNGHGTSNRSG